MENTQRTIILHAQEIVKDKQRFIACSAEINGKWYKIKFVKQCLGAPVAKGLYELTIDFDTCSLEKGKKVKNKDGEEFLTNDIIWIKEIVSIHKYTEEQLRDSNRVKMKDIFGD